MSHEEEIEKIKQKGREERLPLYEGTYANFSRQREHIFDALHALKAGDPGVEVQAVAQAIDDLISLTQLLAAQAEHDAEFKAFLEGKNFIVMKSLPDEITE